MYIYAILVFVWWLINKQSNPRLKNLSEKAQWSFCFKLSIPLILVLGLRHVSVGSDTEQYKFRYDMSEALMTDENYQWEVGYNILNYFFHNILHLDWQFFLLFVSVFFCVVLARFISNYSKSPLLSFYLHLTIGIFIMSLSGIRQCIAISLCYISFMILLNEEKKKKRALIISLLLLSIAFTFHNSAVIFLPFLFFLYYRHRLSKAGAFVWILLGISSIAIKGFLGPYIMALAPSKYEHLSLTTNYAANILVLIIPIIIAFFCLYYSKPEKDGKFTHMTSIMFIFISMVIFFVNLQSLNNQIGRLAQYFQYSYLVLIPYSLYSMPQKESKIIKPIIIVVCAFYFVIGNLGDIMQGDEYHFFWEDVKWISRDYFLY